MSIHEPRPWTQSRCMISQIPITRLATIKRRAIIVEPIRICHKVKQAMRPGHRQDKRKMTVSKAGNPALNGLNDDKSARKSLRYSYRSWSQRMNLRSKSRHSKQSPYSERLAWAERSTATPRPRYTTTPLKIKRTCPRQRSSGIEIPSSSTLESLPSQSCLMTRTPKHVQHRRHRSLCSHSSRNGKLWDRSAGTHHTGQHLRRHPRCLSLIRRQSQLAQV